MSFKSFFMASLIQLKEDLASLYTTAALVQVFDLCSKMENCSALDEHMFFLHMKSKLHV